MFRRSRRRERRERGTALRDQAGGAYKPIRRAARACPSSRRSPALSGPPSVSSAELGLHRGAIRRGNRRRFRIHPTLSSWRNSSRAPGRSTTPASTPRMIAGRSASRHDETTEAQGDCSQDQRAQDERAAESQVLSSRRARSICTRVDGRSATRRTRSTGLSQHRFFPPTLRRKIFHVPAYEKPTCRSPPSFAVAGTSCRLPS